MAEDWLADVRKYHSGADEGVVRKITNYLGIALRNRDSSLVSFSDPAEVGRVRERFLRKKLALTGPDAELNAGLDAVRQMMAADTTKNRVTVYYLLADYFGKLDLFGGAARAPGGFSFGAAGAAAGAATAKSVKVAKPVKVAAAAASTGATRDVREGARTPANVGSTGDESRVGVGGIGKWLLLAAAIVLAFVLWRAFEHRDAAPVAAAPSDTAAAGG